jgi:hypothetical protein
MIAHARIPLGTNRWKFHAKGSGNVRLIINGQVALEDCRGSLFEATAEYESTAAAKSEVVVEHFTGAAISPFELTIEPVLKAAAPMPISPGN